MLKVDGIDLHYGASQALWRVSLNAVAGEITCVLGRNGVGKTSTLRAVVGQVRPSGGRIEWDGQDITGLSTVERARRGIALVPQGREIFPLLTVEENLQTGFGVLPRPERKIPEHIFELFPILKTMLRRRGGDLSGGQQQQLAIGRALIMKPRLLVLDEPTEGIQPSIIKDIGRVLELLRAQGQMAILLVEQYLDFARGLADRLAIMDRGQVVLSGRPDQLDDQDVRRYLTV
ncbi:MAG: urea ABC transporter ATP-binding subunit UrtE [Geminicoccaceae bacterium]